MDGFSKMLVPVICLLLMGYFGYHGLEGRYGLYAQEKLVVKLTALKQKNDRLEKKRRYLEHQIALLAADRISGDLLDELAHKILNLSNENDSIIWSNDKN